MCEYQAPKIKRKSIEQAQSRNKYYLPPPQKQQQKNKQQQQQQQNTTTHNLKSTLETWSSFLNLKKIELYQTSENVKK